MIGQATPHSAFVASMIPPLKLNGTDAFSTAANRALAALAVINCAHSNETRRSERTASSNNYLAGRIENGGEAVSYRIRKIAANESTFCYSSIRSVQLTGKSALQRAQPRVLHVAMKSQCSADNNQ